MQEVVNNLSMLGNANKANSKPLHIIIGTMPGKESRAGGFFYLSSRNSFWSIMSRVLNIDFKSLIEAKRYDEVKDLLEENGYILTDVLRKCEIEGSKDSSIKYGVLNEELNEIIDLLKSGKIEKIFFNGKKAHKLFKQYYKYINESSLIILPSSSNANTKTIEWKANIWDRELRN